jgi:hypothetical protein
MHMLRNPCKTVTSKESFALLVQAVSSLEATGKASFVDGLGPAIHVRAVTLREIRQTAKTMEAQIRDHFYALLSLRDAIEARDEMAIANAKERVKRIRLLDTEYKKLAMGREKTRRRYEKTFASVIELLPELRPDTEAQEDPAWLLSYEVSRMMSLNTQIVLWAVDGVFRPAIYCFDMKTALYLHTFFLAPSGGLGFRICPYDGELFFQKRTNQEYCIPAHREAHRVKRARWRKQNLGASYSG